MRNVITFAAALLAGSVVSAADKPGRSPAEEAAIAKIQQLSGLVLELAQNDPRLEVSYQQRDGQLTDDCLKLLKDLKGLVHLNLRGQAVTDAQTAFLKDLTGLTRLHLENTKITDQGLANLKGLVNLEYLNLYGTAVTDAGLPALEGLKKLKHLYLWQTKVTDAGVGKLKQKLPQVEIVRGFDEEKPKDAKKPEPKKDPKQKK
jgi:hypothetical protein